MSFILLDNCANPLLDLAGKTVSKAYGNEGCRKIKLNVA